MHSDQKALYRGLSHAAWGYFFLNLDINLGSFSVTPRFVGYWLLLRAIRALSGERRDLGLLRPLGLLLTAWSAVDWLLTGLGMGLAGHSLFLNLIAAAAGLYFHFQFLTDMAALAEKYQPEGGRLDRRLLRCRTVYVVLLTAVSLLLDAPCQLPAAWRAGLVTALGAAAIAAAIWIMAGLFRLRRCFKAEAPAP